jgi:hypothetical protein
VVDQQPQVELRPGQRRHRQRVDSRGQRGPGDGDRVDLVALATRAARAARAGRQPGRDTNHPLAARDQKPLQRSRDMSAILERPDPFAVEAARPDQQRREAASSDLDRFITEDLAGRAFDGGDGVRALVGVRPEHDHGPRPRPFFFADAGRPADRACWGRCHAPIKSRRTSPTGDERHNKRRSDPTGRQPQRESARRPVGTISSASDVTDPRIETASLTAGGGSARWIVAFALRPPRVRL